MRNTEISSGGGHARFPKDLYEDPVPAGVISAVANLITIGKIPNNYFSRNIVLQEI